MKLYNRGILRPITPKNCVTQTYGAKITCNVNGVLGALSLTFDEYRTPATSLVLLTVYVHKDDYINYPLYLYAKVKRKVYSRFNNGATRIYNAMFDDMVYEDISPDEIFQRIADKISLGETYVVFNGSYFYDCQCKALGEELETEIDIHYSEN